MRNAARILAALFLIPYSLFLVAVAPANAQVNPYAVPQTNPDVPQNMHTLAQSAFIEAMAAVSCQLTGIDPINPHGKCLGIDAQTGKIGFVDPSKSSGGGGAIGVTSKAISMLFTPPIHTSDYFAYLGENFGITKKAYAQGTGFTSLTPLLPLWSAFRNIVYLLFIIVFVVVGLAIMLRL
ncbi:MAG: hypothetical protein HY429_00640, partial [Candidatus Levybacteria bacterium]|nr:hypothetical protein [Candidatus Levybacteria bacterium]